MKIELSWKIFEKYSNIKFYKNPSSGGELLQADAETDRQSWRSWQSFFAILRTRLNAKCFIFMYVVISDEGGGVVPLAKKDTGIGHLQSVHPTILPLTITGLPSFRGNEVERGAARTSSNNELTS